MSMCGFKQEVKICSFPNKNKNVKSVFPVDFRTPWLAENLEKIFSV